MRRNVKASANRHLLRVSAGLVGRLRQGPRQPLWNIKPVFRAQPHDKLGKPELEFWFKFEFEFKPKPRLFAAGRSTRGEAAKAGAKQRAAELFQQLVVRKPAVLADVAELVHRGIEPREEPNGHAVRGSRRDKGANQAVRLAAHESAEGQLEDARKYRVARVETGTIDAVCLGLVIVGIGFGPELEFELGI